MLSDPGCAKGFIMSTDEKDIQQLFDKVAEHFKGADEGARGMFAMLVETTLKYRDALMHSTGHALTVGETRDALAAFMETMQTHEIRKDLPQRVHDLVVLWLEQLRERKHN